MNNSKKVEFTPTSALGWALGSVVVAAMVTVSVIAKAKLWPKKK